MKRLDSRKITPRVLRALRGGDEQAFEMVYLRYMTSVRSFLSALMRSDDIGEELTQELFVNLWEKRENIDVEKSISGYLYTIAKNLAFKALNRHKNSNIGESVATDNVASQSLADDKLIENEMELLIETAVNRMPPRRSRIFLLSRSEGLSNREIAERLGISKNTVENHVTSALSDIRKVLGMMLAFFI